MIEIKILKCGICGNFSDTCKFIEILLNMLARTATPKVHIFSWFWEKRRTREAEAI